MPAASQIIAPTPFEIWRETPILFDEPVAATRTRVINDIALNGTRYAFGVSSEGYWFFIRLTTIHQEAEFWRVYLNWRETTTGDHDFSAAPATKLPPTCGTPNTPLCPPPDELQQARNDLRDTLAGVGADEATLRAAEARVDSLLLSTLLAAAALVAPLQ